jgi:flagellar hook-length control protein FliK
VAEIVQDVRTQIERLRQNDGFLGFLRQTGQQASFEQAAQRVLDRQTGGQLQNLRGQEAPYLFFEVPFPPTAPIRNAQVHVLGEGRGRKQRFDPQNTAVAIDLTTTRLGDLWISLAIHQGVCRCSIRARTPEIVRAIEAHASELTERLAVAGYRAAQVSASLWNGDRISEAVGLFARFAGVSVQV